jgi:hypothetical protein
MKNDRQKTYSYLLNSDDQIVPIICKLQGADLWLHILFLLGIRDYIYSLNLLMVLRQGIYAMLDHGMSLYQPFS